MTVFYIHKIERFDDDPDYPSDWTEYRVGTYRDRVPEYSESLAGGDGEYGLAEAIEFVKQQGGEHEIVQ